METHLSASVGPILPAATLISGLLSWFSPLFFAEASPDPLLPPPRPPPPPSPFALQPLHLLDTLPPAPRVSRRRALFRATRVKESETAKDGKERRDDAAAAAAFRRIVPLKESDAKAHYLHLALSFFLCSLCLVPLYSVLYSRSTPFSPFQ